MLVFKNELRNIVNEHSVRGFVDWNNASEFCFSLKYFLDERVGVLIEKNCLLQAFELNNQILHVIGTVDMDDSDGESGMVAEKCYENWLKIYQKADGDEKAKIQKFFFEYEEGTLLDDIEEYIFAFRDNELASTEEIKEAMEELDKLIASRTDSNNCGYLYSVVGGNVSVIQKRMEYMKKLGATKDEIDLFLKKNRRFSVVREMEINDAIKNEEFEKAITVLTESKDLDRNNEALLRKYSCELIELYKNTGNISGYVEELKYNLLNYTQTNAELFKELKENISDKKEWSALSNEIIEKNRGSHSVYAFLNEEDRYDEMMDQLDKSNDIYTMNEYAKILSKNVPDRIIAFYTNYVTGEINRASDKKHYRYLANYLKTMSFCPNGKESAKRIAENWKLEYRRQTNMLDELRKAGY